MLNGPEELCKCIVDLLLTMFDLVLRGVPQNHLDTKVPDGLSMGMGKDVWVVLLQFILLLVIIWNWTVMFQQNSNFSCLLRRGPIRSRDVVVLAHFMLNERLRRVACWVVVSAILSRHS